MTAAIYIGVFLNLEQREKLLSCVPPKFEKVHADHVTLIFRPTDEDVASFALGSQVEFEIVAEVADDRAQAVLVAGVASRNKYPHITIATAPGTKPVYSNELLEKCTHRVLTPSVKLVGTIDTYPSSQQIVKEIANG